MRVDLLNGGLAALQAQNASPGSKITVTRFDLGDATNFTFASSMTGAQGTIIHGVLSDMRYYPMNADKSAIQCNISPTRPFLTIGNYVLFVSFQGTEYPFAMVRPHDPLIYNVHLNATGNAVGTDLYVHVMLDIPGLSDRFDFSNLTMDRPEFLAVDAYGHIPVGFSDLHDQLFLATYPTLGRPVVAFNSGNEWFGYQMMRKLEDTKILELSGGATGDGFLYGIDTGS